MTGSKNQKNDPANAIHDEPGRSVVNSQPINWNDSCVIPPRPANKRADQKSRELNLDDFDAS